MYRFTSVAIFPQYTLFIFIGTPNTFQHLIFLLLVLLISSSRNIPLFSCILHPYPQRYSLCVVIISYLASYFSCYARSRIHLLFFFSWICCIFNLTSTF
ncbi:uncharacterized protein EV154DRAFT_533276 [Mucor mucedo]|uniref:uncharacterized protein n=1 Tax=Mucor mucedo TaxID=29922 RepID=UPI002220CC4D|nr:uncharacterized protein EV154DRAFT_533276 [Mucor mucedo]KAI7865318.1 hypothetical protein EV154DRAFT_533276 [Mucor mucedo]